MKIIFCFLLNKLLLQLETRFLIFWVLGLYGEQFHPPPPISPCFTKEILLKLTKLKHGRNNAQHVLKDYNRQNNIINKGALCHMESVEEEGWSWTGVMILREKVALNIWEGQEYQIASCPDLEISGQEMDRSGGGLCSVLFISQALEQMHFYYF